MIDLGDSEVEKLIILAWVSNDMRFGESPLLTKELTSEMIEPEAAPYSMHFRGAKLLAPFASVVVGPATVEES